MPYEQPPLFTTPTPPSPAPPTNHTEHSTEQPKTSITGVIGAVTGTLALALTGVLLLVSPTGINVTTSSNSEGTPINTPAVATSGGYQAVAEYATPSVVTIAAANSTNYSTGSGVVMDADAGYIVTNAHVITAPTGGGDSDISVRTHEGNIHVGQVVGYDELADIAVVKVEGGIPGASSAVFSTEESEVGETAIGIGSPMGLSETMTTGIISAVNRPVPLLSNSGEPTIISALQTDAALNTGNSGGGLFNENGELIGINVAITTSSSQDTGSIGIGYAIPAEYALRIAQDILETGAGQHASLGVTITDSLQENSNVFTTGAVIESVDAGSPSALAGIQQGDIIKNINDYPIESANQLVAMIRQKAPQEEIAVTLLTPDGEEKTLNVTLGNAN